MFMHANNGKCQKCREIIDRYPGFYPPMRKWFSDLQSAMPDVHVSCAGRGQLDQEACFIRGASNAHWTKSAHNWNCALDLWANIKNKDGKVTPKEMYNLGTFKEIELSVPDWIDWYGKKGSNYLEFPHYEVKDWQSLKDVTLHIVEGE